MFTLTSEILRKISNIIPPSKARVIVDSLNLICPQYGINSADIFHEFIANVLHESSSFTKFKENLNYNAKRLTEVWPSRFTNITYASRYARNPLKLAEKVYGGRMGNIHPGDGSLFIGSGPIQMTGRGMVTAFTEYSNKLTGKNIKPEEMPLLLQTDLVMGIHSACWFFSIAKNLIPLAIQDDIKKIILRINGGYIGIRERMHFYELAKKYIV